MMLLRWPSRIGLGLLIFVTACADADPSAFSDPDVQTTESPSSQDDAASTEPPSTASSPVSSVSVSDSSAPATTLAITTTNPAVDEAGGSEVSANEDPAAVSAFVRNAEIPAMCGHAATALTEGEHPNADPGYLTVSEPLARADLDGDGTMESVAVRDCSAGGVAFPSGLMFFDSDHAFLAVLELDQLTGVDDAWRGAIESVRDVGGSIALTGLVERGAMEELIEVAVIVHDPSCVSRLDLDVRSVVSVDPISGGSCNPGGSVPAAPLVAPADCVDVPEFNLFVENPPDQVARYQLALRSAGYFAGAIDGEYDDRLLAVGQEESFANGNLENRPEGMFAELFPDDGAILRGAFERLGVACAQVATSAEPVATAPAPVAAPSVEAATELVRQYLLAAGARNYSGAWALLTSDYQAKYGGYDSFQSFWDTVALTGYDAVRDLGAAGATRTLDIDIWFDRFDGTRSSEVVHIDITETGGGQMISDYRFQRIRE